MAKYDDDEVRESGLTEREEETLPEWAQDRIKGLRAETQEPPQYVQGGMLDKARFEIDGRFVDASIRFVSVEDGKVAYLDLTSQDSLSVLPRSSNSVAIVPRGLVDEKTPSTDSP